MKSYFSEKSYSPPQERAQDQGPKNTLDMLLAIPLEVVAQLGRARMSIEELRLLDRGSIIQLDKNEGAPLDILVNGKSLGKAETVVLDNQKLGVRITETLPPEKRLTTLSRSK